MSSLWPRVNRWLVWFHRWAGVALCLLVAAWFVSGALLHFVPYPALARGEHLAHSETIELTRVRIAPGAALARMPDVSDLRLVSVAGRPTYVGRTPLDTSVCVGADTGEVLAPWSAATAQGGGGRFGGTKGGRVG